MKKNLSTQKTVRNQFLKQQPIGLQWVFEVLVGMTGFEPATTRPPDVYATGLRYIPLKQMYRNLKKMKIDFFERKLIPNTFSKIFSK